MSEEQQEKLEPGATSTELEAAVQASEDEAHRKPPKIFMVGEDIALVLPRRWKRAKFLKAMHRGDLWGAFASIWPDVPVYETDEDTEEPKRDPETGEKIPKLDRDGEPELETHPELAKLEEVDMDEDEFQLLLERLGETLMGRKPPKGKASGR